MRIQSTKPICIGKSTIGGADVLICVPIVEEEECELEQTSKSIALLEPDVVEWRADYFIDVCNPKKVMEALRALRGIIGDIPLIFTLRSSLEGGFKKVEDHIRFDIIRQAILSGEIDAVDIELASSNSDIERIKKAAEVYDIPLILSYHNYAETPSVELLLDKIREEVSKGADIAKIAVMPQKEEDVLNLLSATLKARKEMPDTPLITVSMGELGTISRIAGGVFGSDLTFGAWEKTSAPGQISIDQLRPLMKRSK